MKYIFIFIGWIFLTIYLIIEIGFKIAISILMTIWDFKFKKERYAIWQYIYICIPVIFGMPIHGKFKTLSDYYMLKNFESLN
jgi:hypothetical protein